MNSIDIYLPNRNKLLELFKQIHTLPGSFHLRDTLMCSRDLFLAQSLDTTYLLSVINKQNTYTMSNRQRLLFIQEVLSEYIPYMDQEMRTLIDEYASYISGRESSHYYTADLIDQLYGEYEELVRQRYHYSGSGIMGDVLTLIINEHIDNVIPHLDHFVRQNKIDILDTGIASKLKLNGYMMHSKMC